MKAGIHNCFKEAVSHFFEELSLAPHHILIIQNTTSQQNFMLV